jgi:serine/threonine protein kinase
MNSPAFDAPDLETMNRRLPAFEFKAVIASNEYGAVYFARQRSLERDVAIKFLAPSVSESSGFRQSFESTARMMAKLNHPNLIGVYDSGFVEGMLYFVMEFVPGKSLDHSSRGQQVQTTQAVRLVSGICDGLAHAQDHGIVHGNVNPANILLNQKAEPKIGNFGFAHPKEAAADSESASCYTAPEVSTNPASADSRADIYSVGAILYELVTAKPHGPGAAPPSGLSNCGAELDSIWRQATDRDPSRRFSNMRAFHKALGDFLNASQKSKAKAGPAAPGAPGAAVRPPLAALQMPVQKLPPKKRIHPGLIVQLAILVGLMIATPVIWKKLEKSRDDKARAEREARVKEADAKRDAFDEELRRAQEEARRNKKPVPVKPTLPEPEPAKETPAESLARLRDALASGDRTEMPGGSVHQGDNDYFLVAETMSWPEAAAFADQHGGHLAIPNPSADLTWLVANVSNSEAVWIGAARSGARDWSLADGSQWKPAKEPNGTGAFVAVDKSGFLRAAGPKQRLPFIIQWHRDGTNPGKLAALLARTGESLGKSAPSYPPGTIAAGNRNFLFVARPMMWREAVDLAATSGGHLAVASEPEEIAVVSEITNDLNADDGIWLGGFRKGEQWIWITGEPWKTAKWAAGSSNDSPDSALIVRPGKGWDARNLSEISSGFIIEWSNDRKSKPGSATGTPNVEISTLTGRAKELILAADRKRSEKLAANARKVSWDLDIYLRNLPKSDLSIWETHVSRLKNCAVNNRLPASIPRSSGIRLSENMAKIAEDGAIQQGKIDEEFLVDAEKVRIAYIVKLRDALAQAERSGQRTLVQSLGEALENAANLADWLRSFDVVPKPENPVPGKTENKPRAPRDTEIKPVPRGGDSFVE